MSTTPVKSYPTTTITGRISSIDSWPAKNPTRFNTLVRLPSEDEYATPETVELTSTHSIGKEGEVIRDVLVRCGGRYRSYPVTDKQTGEMRTVKTADNSFTVL
jgi:hypothetical protein